MDCVLWYHSVCDFTSVPEQWHWSLKCGRSLIYRLFASFSGSEAGGEDALVGNVNKLMMSPPGYSGASRKGHLVFDACFESGEYLSPVCPTHEIPVMELPVLYMLIWCWIRCKELSARLFHYHFIIRHEIIHIGVSKFVLQGQMGKHLTHQHYTWHRYNSPQHKHNIWGDLCSDSVSL